VQKLGDWTAPFRLTCATIREGDLQYEPFLLSGASILGTQPRRFDLKEFRYRDLPLAFFLACTDVSCDMNPANLYIQLYL
jgi:hypothetical protein